MWLAEVDFPEELIRAHRDGELVLFVGAGASMGAPANLPRFSGVVEQVCAKTGENARQDDVVRHPDVVLGRLAGRGVDVHGLVAELISPPDSQPNDVHRGVVDLALASTSPRIVTTNWDRHVSTVMSERGWDGEVYRAPALPVGNDFEGVVYLHGSTTQPPKNLVMTDGDFGRAYLTDAWAARFMARLFSRFTTLFVGYSHDDVVMSYLAQGLQSGSPPRYVLTDMPDNPRWRQLGIFAVGYSPADAHVALPTAIASWASAADRGALDHAQRTRQLVGERQPDLGLDAVDPSTAPLTREETSYLEAVLRDPSLVGFFTAYARGEIWLQWALTQPVFERVFTDTSRDDACVNALARWVTLTFLNSEEDSNLLLELLFRRGGRLGAPLWRAVAERLSYRVDGAPTWTDPWILLLVRDSAPDGGAFLSFVLQARAHFGAADDAVLLLFEHLLRPNISLATSFRTIGAPRIEITMTGDTSTMAHLWTGTVEEVLPLAADRFLDMAEQHLIRAYQLIDAAGTFSDEWDPLSYRRAAIERHPQNASTDAVDVLVDIARDALVSASEAGGSQVVDRLDRWARSPRRLLRRLAVHGYAFCADLTPTTRLQWLIGSEALHDISCRHEAFQLIAVTAANADVSAVDALTEHILGWPLFDGTNAEQYRVSTMGDALAWLVRFRPDHIPTVLALADLHGRFEFGESEHPDLQRWTETGWVARIPSIAIGDLHELVAADPASAVTQLVEAAGRPRTWELQELSADEAVRALSAAYPRDGLAILDADHPQAREFTDPVTEGLADAELEYDIAVEAAETLAAGPLALHARAIAALLLSSDRNQQPVRWTDVPAARQLAAAVWEAAAPDVEETEHPTLNDALNVATGLLALFWVKAAEDTERTQSDSWSGLTDDLAATFATILGIDTPEPARQSAQIVCAAHVFALWSIDETWTRETIMPLLNCTDVNRVRSTWAGYLTWGRWNDAMLKAGLLDGYLRAAEVLDAEFADAHDGFGDLQGQLANHVADICMNSSVTLLEEDGTGFLTDWTRAARPDLRTRWLDSIAWGLHEAPSDFVEHLWTTWLRSYWTMRTQTAPEPLTDGEQSALVAIAAHLNESLPSAVELALTFRAPLDRHRDLLATFTTDRIRKHPAPVARLVAHMLKSTVPPTWAVSDPELRRVVTDLRAVTTDDAVTAVVNAAVTMVGAHAADW